MRNLKISICYHPTTIVFVDDDEGYLSQLFNYFKNIFPCITFGNPIKALEYLNTQKPETFIQRCTAHIEENDVSSKYLFKEFDVSSIQKELVRPERFEETVIVVADYDMPAMSGIDFCSKIGNPHILKLLLTGVADSEIVIQAFNKRKINNYLKKGEADLIPVLLKEIVSLEVQYFLNLSNILMNQVGSKILSSLEDVNVANLFQKLCIENDIVEHYLMSNEGDFLCANKEGKISRFSVKNTKEIEDMYIYALDENAPDEIVSALKNKEKIPLFITSEAIDETEVSEWGAFLHPIQKVPGSNDFYFAYKNDFVHLPKSLKDIVSLRNYLTNPQ